MCVDLSGFDRRPQQLPIFQGLLGIRRGEAGDRRVERAAAAHIPRDRRRIAGPRMRPRQCQAAESCMMRQAGLRELDRHPREAGILQLPDIAVLIVARLLGPAE